MPTTTDVTAGPIILRPKMKNCGREDCSACPHGPYFYAVLSPYQTPSHRRHEIYLGQSFTPADLRAKVLPQVSSQVGGKLSAYIVEQEAIARRAKLVKRIGDLNYSIEDVEAEARRRTKVFAGERDALQRELAALDKNHPTAKPVPKRA